MLDILAWTIFGFTLAVMVALSGRATYCSEEPSSSEAEGKPLKRKGGEK